MYYVNIGNWYILAANYIVFIMNILDVCQYIIAATEAEVLRFVSKLLLPPKSYQKLHAFWGV